MSPISSWWQVDSGHAYLNRYKELGQRKYTHDEKPEERRKNNLLLNMES
jgi:hypothetical protein